jgi:hypothetical protein
MTERDLRQLPRNDQGVLAAGLLVFIASFFPYYGVSLSGKASGGLFPGGVSHSVTSWHSYATVGLLLVLAATIVAAIAVFARGSLPEIPISWNLVALGLSGLGTLLYIIRSLTLDSGDVGPLSYGLKWGAYVVILLCLAHTAFAFMRVRAAGEPMPWAQHGGAAPQPPAA